MNSKWFGDSFDLVKRFFLSTIKKDGFRIAVNPMFTDDSKTITSEFLKLIDADYLVNEIAPGKDVCLFFDPDTGIKESKSPKHITFQEILCAFEKGYGLIVVYDQSFSRTLNKLSKMNSKLEALQEVGIHCFYFNSHANFLFASKDKSVIINLENIFIGLGLPSSRLIKQQL